MFRRRGIVGRLFFVRRRLLGAALLGGLGFAAGRASRPAGPQVREPSAELAAELRNLADLPHPVR